MQEVDIKTLVNKHYYLNMTNKFTSRKAKDIATASSYAFSKKKIPWTQT